MTALSTDFSFKEYIADTSNNILSKSQVNLLAPACDICNLFLKKVRTGRLVDSTIAYLNLLQKIDFDYSYQSLEKIDKVLEYIKTTEMIPQGRNLHQSNYDDFVNDPARQIFIYLLGCYIGMSSAQLAKTTVKWFNHEQMQEILDDPDYFFSIENNHVMMFDKGYLRLPLMAITNYLFDLNPNSSIGAVGFADNVLRDNASTLISYPLITQGLDPVPTSWHTAATLAGTLAAWNLVHASDGGDFSPMSLDYDLKTKKINLISHMGSDLDVLMGQLDIPSPDSPFGFLSYDMYANLPTGRTDGITIEIRVYSEPKLTLQLILPYRHADHPLGFALYPLVHKQDNHSLSVNELDSLIQAFYQGAKNIKDPFIGVDYWTSYYLDKHDLFAPPAWINHAVETFDPNNSEIELLQIH